MFAVAMKRFGRLDILSEQRGVFDGQPIVPYMTAEHLDKLSYRPEGAVPLHPVGFPHHEGAGGGGYQYEPSPLSEAGSITRLSLPKSGLVA